MPVRPQTDVCVCVSVCKYACAHTYTHIHTHTRPCRRVYVYVYISFQLILIHLTIFCRLSSEPDSVCSLTGSGLPRPSPWRRPLVTLLSGTRSSCFPPHGDLWPCSRDIASPSSRGVLRVLRLTFTDLHNAEGGIWCPQLPARLERRPPP